MSRMNDHLGKGTPEDIQDSIKEVRDGLNQAVMFIHTQLLDSADGKAPQCVDGSYLRDAKDQLIEALIDLSAIEAHNAAPMRVIISTKEFVDAARAGVFKDEPAEGKAQS
jgi:hypothetical protein